MSDANDTDEQGFQVTWPAGYCLKARAAVEQGGKRFVYCEPSSETRDDEGERVFKAALVKAAPDFLRYGNIDIGHFTFRPPPGMSWQEALNYEIGRPVDVKTEPTVLLKALIYQGESDRFAQANRFWDTLEQGAPWYPSIGGKYVPKGRTCGPEGCDVRAIVWRNVAFWREPVNKAVKAVSIMPLGTFAKAVVSGYGSDVSTFTGGRAVQKQSIERGVLRETQGGDDDHFRAAAGRFLKATGTSACAHSARPITAAKVIAHFEQCEGLSAVQAKYYAARLLHDIHEHSHNLRNAA